MYSEIRKFVGIVLVSVLCFAASQSFATTYEYKFIGPNYDHFFNQEPIADDFLTVVIDSPTLLGFSHDNLLNISGLTISMFDKTGSVSNISSDLNSTDSGIEFRQSYDGVTPSNWSIMIANSSVDRYLRYYSTDFYSGYDLFDGLCTHTVTNAWGTSDGGVWTLTVIDGNQTNPVPEPSTLILLGAGLAGVVCLRKRCKM